MFRSLLSVFTEWREKLLWLLVTERSEAGTIGANTALAAVAEEAMQIRDVSGRGGASQSITGIRIGQGKSPNDTYNQSPATSL